MQTEMPNLLIALALAVGVSLVGIQPVISPTCPGANAGPQTAQSATANCVSSLDNVSVGAQINSRVANSQAQSQTSEAVKATTQTNVEPNTPSANVSTQANPEPNTPGAQVVALNAEAKTEGALRSTVFANVTNEIGEVLNLGIDIQPKASIHVDAGIATSANPDVKSPADRAGGRDVKADLRATLFGKIK